MDMATLCLGSKRRTVIFNIYATSNNSNKRLVGSFGTCVEALRRSFTDRQFYSCYNGVDMMREDDDGYTNSGIVLVKSFEARQS